MFSQTSCALYAELADCNLRNCAKSTSALTVQYMLTHFRIELYYEQGQGQPRAKDKQSVLNIASLRRRTTPSRPYLIWKVYNHTHVCLVDRGRGERLDPSFWSLARVLVIPNLWDYNENDERTRALHITVYGLDGLLMVDA